MDLWSHPTSIQLRGCADRALADANAALALRRAKLQEASARGKGGAAASPQQAMSPALRRHSSGSQRSGSNVVRSGKKGDRVRVEPAGLESAATPAPQASSALKGMNVRALRQRARALGVDEDELAAAVEGNDPKRALISLIQAKETPPAPASAGEAASQIVGAEAGTSSALKGMSVRSLRQRARELGVPEAELTAAIEGADPHTELIKLIQEKTGSPTQVVGATAGSGKSQQTHAALETLPAMLRAALEEVEAVDTSDAGGDGAGGGVIIDKQLNRMKQTYIADLSAVLSQVEAALTDAPSGSTALPGPEDGDEVALDMPAASVGRVASLLEGMEREILHNLLLGPLLPAESLAAVSQTCRGLLDVVRSAEMQQYWAKHWVCSYPPPPPSSTAWCVPMCGPLLCVCVLTVPSRAGVVGRFCGGEPTVTNLQRAETCQSLPRPFSSVPTSKWRGAARAGTPQAQTWQHQLLLLLLDRATTQERCLRSLSKGRQ